MTNTAFWEALDTLVESCEIVVDRPRGTVHPKYPSFVYHVDYGYLKGTASMDGDGIDIWRGSLEDKQVNAVVCTVDLMKKDSEIKLLLGCTEEEMQTIYKTHNESPYMKGILIRREKRK